MIRPGSEVLQGGEAVLPFRGTSQLGHRYKLPAPGGICLHDPDLTRGACMPADRITPTSHGESFNDTLVRLRDAGRAARAALGRLSLEGWLAVACAIVVMWALGWF